MGAWLFAAILCFLSGLYYLHQARYKANIARSVSQFDGVGEMLLLAKEELSVNEDPRLLLSIVNHVFDVSAGAQFYGTGKPYGPFSGRDATRAFATGDFEADLIESAEGLSRDECSSILSWLGFYKKSSKYHFVGYLKDGIYFDVHEDSSVERSSAFHDLIECAGALQEDATREKCLQKFDFKLTVHTKRCSPGVSVPRRALVSSGERDHFREECICVPVAEADRKDVRPYLGCDPMAGHCQYEGDLSESEL